VLSALAILDVVDLFFHSERLFNAGPVACLREKEVGHHSKDEHRCRKARASLPYGLSPRDDTADQ
jgi:hypothetical protein